MVVISISLTIPSWVDSIVIKTVLSARTNLVSPEPFGFKTSFMRPPSFSIYFLVVVRISSITSLWSGYFVASASSRVIASWRFGGVSIGAGGCC